ncbi:hypothetical protein TGME49_311020 [Toxoplasma gondii ME49]|uniref:Uncharacterized protein n=5 Tax=Toxoplasma gondii TaxID=5811 RepID=A0A125YTA0_TOXGV|nr:hypothetical protein TGME49_311020 [Toxoplasma gondii ME49]ESS34925.1 hypothetical protein TGVEG_311020 [Toxoplasma gondii VEG]KFG65862.1 hypothetical protein TGRUB_311020 [Toxoplasma gondii RUB]KFH18044.1 hypothetical protein TGMAS_311020 [Toxoplasma gondii MAS]KYF47804.1 hypothetical protein TGARI_311020 [Toxoplasma gondii ARI]EPT26130.1 hypothetical protein TGME49_311020 [Toxoplasma gondii ME49]|eukprot:XP_018635540.1 hypothetical protein TGME49_311020 [Toxoplasma gondii ME49]
MAEDGKSFFSSKKKHHAVPPDSAGHTPPPSNAERNSSAFASLKPEDARGDLSSSSSQGQRVQIVEHAVKALFQRSKALRVASSSSAISLASPYDDTEKSSKPPTHGQDDASVSRSAVAFESDGHTSSDGEGVALSPDTSHPISSSSVSTLLWARSLFGEEEEPPSKKRGSARTLLSNGSKGDSEYDPSKDADRTRIDGEEQLGERLEKMNFRSLRAGPASVGGLHIPVIATSLDLHIAPFWRTRTEQEAREEWRKTRAALRSDFKRKHKTAVRSLKGNSSRAFQKKGGSAVSSKLCDFEKAVSYSAF